MKEGICLPWNHPYTNIVTKYDKNSYRLNIRDVRVDGNIEDVSETEEDIMIMWNFVKKLLNQEVEQIITEKTNNEDSSEETEEDNMNFVIKTLNQEIDEIYKDKFLTGPITLKETNEKIKDDSKKKKE
jgi:predicted TIM-barrel fold metal-dependent hydrolase